MEKSGRIEMCVFILFGIAIVNQFGCTYLACRLMRKKHNRWAYTLMGCAIAGTLLSGSTMLAYVYPKISLVQNSIHIEIIVRYNPDPSTLTTKYSDYVFRDEWQPLYDDWKTKRKVNKSRVK